jgi:CRP-like cAMP-binding protein
MVLVPYKVKISLLFYKLNEVIYKEDDLCEKVYFILSGEIEISRTEVVGNNNFK